MSILKLLHIEDDKDIAEDYKGDIEKLFNDIQVYHEEPPIDLLDLISLIQDKDADGVVLDERLQQQSNASYRGSDAIQYIQSILPNFPLQLLTEYPDDPLVKKKILVGQLVNKNQFFEGDKREIFQEFYEQMKNYHQEKSNSEKENKDGTPESWVKEVALDHYKADDSIEEIIWFDGGKPDELLLVEINRTAFPTDSLDVFTFSPSDELPIWLRVIDVTPKDWQRIEEGKLSLPDGWDMTTKKPIARVNGG